MLPQQNIIDKSISNFYAKHVIPRQITTTTIIQQIHKIVIEILKQVEQEEPRFVSSIPESNNFDYIESISGTQFEYILFLNQMGVFNFIDDACLPGYSALKLSDGRKRSMSLWIEFITASGYLSARKIRSRFQSLVFMAMKKICRSKDDVEMINGDDVKLRIKNKYIVQITPGFRCSAIWPKSAENWPLFNSVWPNENLVSQVKSNGFYLLSKETPLSVLKQENDAWLLSFTVAEDILLSDGYRQEVYSILKTLLAHYQLSDIITNYNLKTLVLYECEKHPYEESWEYDCITDRLQGSLLQLINWLQNKNCAHFFLQNVNLFRHLQTSQLDKSTKTCWKILRNLIMNNGSLDNL